MIKISKIWSKITVMTEDNRPWTSRVDLEITVSNLTVEIESITKYFD